LAASAFCPEADTLIEIGGQDSKFTRLHNGVVLHSTMNYVCAAGTGSFIEEQARRLGLSLAEVSQVAWKQSAPYTSDRCTVYMERDLAELSAQNWSRDELMAAVLFSVRDNYLSKVVGHQPMGRHVVFQGATARNAALVAAFEAYLGHPVHVPPYCHLGGAVGAALSAREAGQSNGTSSLQHALGELQLATELCTDCSNRCVLSVLRTSSATLLWGAKCGREELPSSSPDTPGEAASEGRAKSPRRPKSATKTASRSAMMMRHQSIRETLAALASPSPYRAKIGLIRALYHAQYAPLWEHFLRQLGFDVLVAKRSAAALRRGKAMVEGDFCAPMMLAHGAVTELQEAGVEAIFAPILVNDVDGGLTEPEPFRRKREESYFCYYSQYAPTLLSHNSSLKGKSPARFISPTLRLREQSPTALAEALYEGLQAHFEDLDREQCRAAFLQSWSAFEAARLAALRRVPPLPVEGGASTDLGDEDKRPINMDSGEEAKRPINKNSGDQAKRPINMDSGEEEKRPISKRMAVVLVGRPYVAFDEALNLGLAEMLEARGVEVYWQDELAAMLRKPGAPEETDEDAAALEAATAAALGSSYERMHWGYGKTILRAAHLAAQTEQLFVIYLSCFRCSPDAFLISMVKDVMSAAHKPYLVLQVDEHASPVGFQTRIEAALRSFAAFLGKPGVQLQAALPRPASLAPGDTVLMPHLSRLLSAFWARSFEAAGYPTRLLRNDAAALETGYRYANGGECMPAVAIAGGVIEAIREYNLEASGTYVYLPSICMACNFPQFPEMIRLAAKASGMGEPKLGALNMLEPGAELPGMLGMRIFECSVVASLLYKVYFRAKAYELEAGSADRVFDEAEALLLEALSSGSGLKAALKQALQRFRELPTAPRGGKPRVAVLGDLYVKYNELVNQGLAELIHAHGAELVIPSLSDMSHHFLDLDVHAGLERPAVLRTLRQFEAGYEKLAADLLGEDVEPEWSECAALLERHGMGAQLAGETAVNVGRALYLLERQQVQMIVHVNPIFCC
ncbi:MAG: acyl-CoA dehydratase activase-related protein, partial [Myxococcota bacterium]|nr:acyl-CoA dehydratase activase-related protein [Myxococcota bacterium]